ncbi:hypothetical protein E8E11_001682 [Didymella keratinophila]|nr:hypothetical protein E8E11_001682 [Didymella keratinophila]
MPALDRSLTIHEATGDVLSPDPATITRDDFTKSFLNFRSAPNAHAVYKHLFDNHQTLIRLLVNHPAVRPHLTQTFNTPANSKNKVYFIDDPRNPIYGEMVMDVFGRASIAKTLILNDTGKLEQLNASVGYSHDEDVDSGDEIKREAQMSDKSPE